MARPDKVQKVDKLVALLDASEAAVIVDYSGLSVSQMVALRAEIRKVGGDLHVVKNTLFRRALQGRDSEALSEHVVGPVGVVFCAAEVGEPAKVAVEFASKTPALEVKAAWADGRVYNAAETAARSKMASRKDLIGQLASVLNAPLSGLACGLGGIITRLPRALNEVAAKNEAA